MVPADRTRAACAQEGFRARSWRVDPLAAAARGRHGGTVSREPGTAPSPSLPRGPVLAVCAHPDDESFGLGGVLAACTAAGEATHLLCLTLGERSTLGGLAAPELAERRIAELDCAAGVLGLRSVARRTHPDGALAAVPLDALADTVVDEARRVGAASLLTFDEGGVSGHPDHEQATRAAVAAGGRMAIPVYGWALPHALAAQLARETGQPFVGRPRGAVDLVVPVDRARQWTAIRCHRSQLSGNRVLRRRLALAAPEEWLRELRPDGPGRPAAG